MHYGLDIGGTKIEITAFDHAFVRGKSVRVPTPKADYQEFLQTISQLVHQFDGEYGCEGSVGVGIPGVEDQYTGKLTISNVPCLQGRQLRRDLSAKLGRAVVVENDARCFVFSEAFGGSANDYSCVFGVILGTGLGGSLCFEKTVHRGRNNLAGEWGHTSLPAFLQQKYQLPIISCGCGLVGCYERYISGPGIAALHQHLTGEALTTPDIISQMRAGDAEAIATFDCFIDIAGAALAGLMLVVDPDAFVLGGGVSNVAEIYECLPQAIERHLFGNNKAPIVLAPMFGDSGGVRGAAILGSQLV